MMRMVVDVDRFVSGDFPMICCRSGRPATKLVSVEARRNELWPWLFFPGLVFAVVHLFGGSKSTLWGRLPFAEGHVREVKAEVERGVGVILQGIHPDFVRAVDESR